jgi:hypothetical protein
MAFTGPPKIVRIWGQGRALENGTPAYEAFIAEHKVKTIPGSRSIIIIDVHQCGTSCGFSVPYYDFVGHRDILNEHFRKKEQKYIEGEEKESMDYYWALKSQLSIDGLPGMKRGYEFAQKHGVKPLEKMVGSYAPGKGGVRRKEGVDPMYLFVVLLLGMVIGGAMALSVVTPERLRMLQEKGMVV